MERRLAAILATDVVGYSWEKVRRYAISAAAMKPSHIAGRPVRSPIRLLALHASGRSIGGSRAKS